MISVGLSVSVDGSVALLPGEEHVTALPSRLRTLHGRDVDKELRCRTSVEGWEVAGQRISKI